MELLQLLFMLMLSAIVKFDSFSPFAEIVPKNEMISSLLWIEIQIYLTAIEKEVTWHLLLLARSQQREFATVIAATDRATDCATACATACVNARHRLISSRPGSVVSCDLNLCATYVYRPKHAPTIETLPTLPSRAPGTSPISASPHRSQGAPAGRRPARSPGPAWSQRRTPLCYYTSATAASPVAPQQRNQIQIKSRDGKRLVMKI